MINIFKKLFPSREPAATSEQEADDQTAAITDAQIMLTRGLLKEATQLKREKKYDEACEKLRCAYAAPGAVNLMIEERLRLPMYLQLAGRNDEGWRVFMELKLSHSDTLSQAIIENQMRVFLEKEKKYKRALISAAWCLCLEANHRRELMISQQIAEDFTESVDPEWDWLREGKDSLEGVRYDPSKGFEEAVSVATVTKRFASLFKKLNMETDIDRISAEYSEYLQSTNLYDFDEVQRILFHSAINQ